MTAESENTRRVILLAGPGGFAFNREDVSFAEKSLRKSCSDSVCIGDGEKNLTAFDFDSLFSALDVRKNITLIIMAHGTVDKYPGGADIYESHSLDFTGDFSTKAKEFFKKITQKMDGRSIDIFSTACHGGNMHYPSTELLPKGSTYVSLAPSAEPVSGFDVNRFFNSLNQRFVGDATAENLLYQYLVLALNNRCTPTINSPKSNFDLQVTLRNKIGKTFTDEEKKRITSMKLLVDEETLNKVIAKIESAKDEMSISSKDYGLALAVCSTAQENMCLNRDNSLQIKSDVSKEADAATSLLSYRRTFFSSSDNKGLLADNHPIADDKKLSTEQINAITLLVGIGDGVLLCRLLGSLAVKDTIKIGNGIISFEKTDIDQTDLQTKLSNISDSSKTGRSFPVSLKKGCICIDTETYRPSYHPFLR